MARLSISSATLTPPNRQNDALTDLTRLLSRLQQTVLRADAERERRLRTSEYERKRVATNIDHARTLLTKLEQDALGTKFQLPRQDLVRDLDHKREVLEMLTERMRDLEDIAAGEMEEDGEGWGEEEEGSESGEDILAEIIATPSESLDSRGDVVSQDEDAGDDEEGRYDEQDDVPSFSEPEPKSRSTDGFGKHDQSPPPAQNTAETTTSSTLRARTTQPPPTQSVPPSADTNPTTAATSSRALLLGTNSSAPSLSTTEAVLDHQRQEQDFLSESILKMATDLKTSSLSFSDALDTDKDIVNRTGQGLDKNERGLEAAARRMSTLVRATEGKGWIGRIILYAWVYGLMLLLVVVVFGLPKLRF